MKKTFVFIVKLEKPYGEIESYELEGKNIALFRVRSPSGEIISGDNCIVQITLSREARLGLGIELIRSNLKVTEMHPNTKRHTTQNLGVFLHPKSCNVSIYEDDLGTVEEAMKKAKKE